MSKKTNKGNTNKRDKNKKNSQETDNEYSDLRKKMEQNKWFLEHIKIVM